ncbi:hypothetical protein NP493_2344g00005 [Ridgeia piscesae]|uniref:Uncharacterized protein n=1 Tax=Ridgeia piscesae TaxID=27915 RepID=A0AAD9N2N6_RIDPI|nr:hypothetical protein NP493_2344g00005 [Ridgeia piscesae]
MLTEFYSVISPALIARFKEREENVKADIFHAYITLLRQTKPTVSATDPDAMDQEEGPVAMLQSQIAALVKTVHKQLREKSIKTRQGCFCLLNELVQVLPGALTNHISAIIPGIQFSLGQSYTFTSQSYNFTSKSYNFTSQSYNFTSQSYNFTSQSYNFTSQSYTFTSGS